MYVAHSATKSEIGAELLLTINMYASVIGKQTTQRIAGGEFGINWFGHWRRTCNTASNIGGNESIPPCYGLPRGTNAVQGIRVHLRTREIQRYDNPLSFCLVM